MEDKQSVPRVTADQLEPIRVETRFEIGLLHDRVNALLGAEAFLTIAYTAAMSNGAPWGVRFSLVVAPILSVLGLLLALLAWPGVAATVKIILHWTARYDALMLDGASPLMMSGRDVNVHVGNIVRVGPAQRRSMLFFRAVPGLFVVVWAALTVIALVIHR